jgi:hypothetical protein
MGLGAHRLRPLRNELGPAVPGNQPAYRHKRPGLTFPVCRLVLIRITGVDQSRCAAVVEAALLVAEGLYGIDSGCAAAGDETGQYGHQH